MFPCCNNILQRENDLYYTLFKAMNHHRGHQRPACMYAHSACIQYVYVCIVNAHLDFYSTDSHAYISMCVESVSEK